MDFTTSMKTSLFTVLISVVSILSGCAGSKSDMTYTNPLRTVDGDTIYIADPFVYKHEGVYYMTGTTSVDSKFEYYTSPDLINWNFGGILYQRPDDHFGKDCFWAPEVKYYQGKFYMTYSCHDPARGMLLTCLAVSDTPDGPFKDLYTPCYRLSYFR